ncbi:MAG: hypothetical protein ACE5DX_04385 [Candidatus Dojkabacteria bacterium]
MQEKKVKIIKLGGSTFSKGKENLFDFGYLKGLRSALEPSLESGMKFFVVLGGGYTMRMYRDLALAGGVDEDTEVHWIGTAVNVLHAYICKAYFADIADSEVYKFEDYYSDSPLEVNGQMKFGGGGRPGHSGDVDAIIGANRLGVKMIYSLKNVDGVYDADPKKDPNAVLQEKLTWDEYLNIIGYKDEHEPGGNYPIDPVASKMSQDAGITFVILGGDDLENFERALNGEQFRGTIVANN